MTAWFFRSEHLPCARTAPITAIPGILRERNRFPQSLSPCYWLRGDLPAGRGFKVDVMGPDAQMIRTSLLATAIAAFVIVAARRVLVVAMPWHAACDRVSSNSRQPSSAKSRAGRC